MSNEVLAQEKKYKRIITILSIAIPLAVAALFGIKLDVEPLDFLPPIYATINGITAVLLVFAVIAIKKGNRKLHERFKHISYSLLCSFLSHVRCLSYDFRFYAFWRRRSH